jgi:hypothetical protein
MAGILGPMTNLYHLDMLSDLMYILHKSGRYMAIPIGSKAMYKVYAYDESDKLVAEYSFEKMTDAITFQVGMRDKGYATHLQKIF